MGQVTGGHPDTVAQSPNRSEPARRIKVAAMRMRMGGESGTGKPMLRAAGFVRWRPDQRCNLPALSFADTRHRLCISWRGLTSRLGRPCVAPQPVVQMRKVTLVAIAGQSVAPAVDGILRFGPAIDPGATVDRGQRG